MFQQDHWQGNIRELENMIKRAIILQDEQLVIREIERHMQRKAEAAAVARGAFLARRRRACGRGRRWPLWARPMVDFFAYGESELSF